MKGLKSDTGYSINTVIGRMLICIMAVCILAGCGKSQFKIRFEFPKDYQGNYLLTYYAWDSKKGFWVETTAPVQEGKAEIDAFTSRPTLVYISDASSPTNAITVYAEKGDEITLSGDNPDMLTWSIKGNKVSERWSTWRNANREALREVRLGTDTSSDKKEKAIAAYVEENPDDMLSTLLLLTEYDRRKNPEGFLKLWNSLGRKARDPQLTELAGAPDMLGVEFQVDADGRLALAREKILPEIVLRSKDNGTDTLRYSKTGATLLYFYTNNAPDRRSVGDSIKALSKEYPDSAKRIIADISLEPDSIAWVSNLRGDSLTKVIRGWMPRGVADRDMIRMGAVRSPWLIVADNKGSRIYSGQDLSEALRTFRKTMNK